MDYTPYYETMRRTSLLRGMTDAELDTLMACFAPRVRRMFVPCIAPSQAMSV